MRTVRFLIRVDDMGVTHDANEAIVRCHEAGLVTSAGVMPTGHFFEEAARLCRAHPSLAAGVHLALLGGRERPVLAPDDVPTLVREDGFLYDTVDDLEAAGPSVAEMERELRAQVAKVLDAGLRCVYLDWHRKIPAAAEAIVGALCEEHRLLNATRVQGMSRLVLFPEKWPSQRLADGRTMFCQGPGLTEKEERAVLKQIRELPDGGWWCACHPKLTRQGGDVTRLLCSSRFKGAMAERGIEMVSHLDLWKARFPERH
ncbi:MAG: ChbG/HpnK family deacetylase [Kiritimatiellae bacterium]|nr:ChbG/HpnK family deacetylase [Kiritimatiellia bacterium]